MSWAEGKARELQPWATDERAVVLSPITLNAIIMKAIRETIDRCALVAFDQGDHGIEAAIRKLAEP